MGILMLALVAATVFSVAGFGVGVLWQRRRTSLQSRSATGALDQRHLEERFDRLEALAEATAVEMERIGEGQRFTTRLLAERAKPRPEATAATDPARHRTPH